MKKMSKQKIIASKFTDEAGTVTLGSHLGRSFGYFSEQTTDFKMGKVNCPENAIIYINQVYLTKKNNKKNVLC